MDQDATWYRGRPWPTQHCVRCGPSYPRKKAHPSPTQFWPMSIVAKWLMDEDATLPGSRPRQRPHCVRRVPSSPCAKGAQQPPLFGPCLLWPRSPITATAELLYIFVTFLRIFLLFYFNVFASLALTSSGKYVTTVDD